MSTKDTQATTSGGNPSGSTVAQGAIHIDLCLNSSITDHEIRKGLRKAFKQEMQRLVGANTSLGDLAAYMKGELTASNRVPGAAKDMLEALNKTGGYLQKIVAKCGKAGTVPLANYEAKTMHGTDAYCIASDGTIRCYHFFSLVSKSESGGPLTVQYKNEVGHLAFCCIGQSA